MDVHWKCDVFLSIRCLVSTIVGQLEMNVASTAGLPFLFVRLYFNFS